MNKKRENSTSRCNGDYNDIVSVFENSSNNFWVIVRLCKGQYGKIVFSILLYMMKHSPVWLLPIISANIVNVVINPKEKAMCSIAMNIFVIVILLIQNIITNYFYTSLYSKVIRGNEYRLRSSLIEKIQKLSMSYHLEMIDGILQSKIIRDVEQIQSLSSEIFISIFSIILNIIVALFIVLKSSTSVFLFFLLTIPISVLIYYSFRKKIKKCNRKFRENMEKTTASVTEMISLIPITKAHAIEETEIEKMNVQLYKMKIDGIKLDLTQSLFGSISWVTFQLFQVLCLGYTGYLVLKGKLLPGDIVMYQTYFSLLVNQVGSMVSLIPNIEKGIESVNSIGDVIRSDEIENEIEKIELNKVDGKIEFRNVCFRYKNDVAPIFYKLNFVINKGETIAFVGRTGVGKTTILNLIIGFYQAYAGQVFIDGKNINDISLSSYRKFISVVPQSPVLFTGTIRENILFGLDEPDDTFFGKVLKITNLDELISDLPNGLDTMIMGNGSNLSGGQKQRISIARALVRNPKILILDEATSSLDTISERKIQNGLNEFMHGFTTIIVAHRLSTIKNADRIIVVGNRGIIETGSYSELLEKKGDFFEFCSI